MPAAAEINESLIRAFINRAVSDVFKTMVNLEPTELSHEMKTHGAVTSASEPQRPQVVGTVGFVGDINGLVYLHLDQEFARVCAGLMLGMSEAELDEAGDAVINDVVGEITNMTVGGFKNGLCDSGYPCKLTIPSIVRGSNFVIEPISSATRHIYHFACKEHRVMADILIQKEE